MPTANKKKLVYKTVWNVAFSEMSVPHTHSVFDGPLTAGEARIAALLDEEAANDLRKQMKKDRKADRKFKKDQAKQQEALKLALIKNQFADIKTHHAEQALCRAQAGKRRATEEIDHVAGKQIPEPDHMIRDRKALADVDKRAAKRQKKSDEEREKTRAAGAPPPVGTWSESIVTFGASFGLTGFSAWFGAGAPGS